MRAAFTLIEVLVTVAIIALLIAILVPVLSSAREAARVATCTSNLRQSFLACRMYADANRGFGPAIGEPYASLPNWALVVLTYGSQSRTGDNRLYHNESVLVCPTISLYYGQAMTRTYAMNTTGHAGQPGDPGSYDDPDRPAHIRFDRVPRPPAVPLLLDSSRAPIPGPAPPAPRTASMIDFRQQLHVDTRLKRFHRREQSFNVTAFDGSTRSERSVREDWKQPLP